MNQIVVRGPGEVDPLGRYVTRSGQTGGPPVFDSLDGGDVDGMASYR